jgi:hypothetical protein
MPANWLNYAKYSNQDAEGETDNEDAMDLYSEVGSSHPKASVVSSRQPNLSKSLLVNSCHYSNTPANNSVTPLFTPHPTAFCPVPKSLANIVIPRISQSTPHKQPEDTPQNRSKPSSSCRDPVTVPKTSMFFWFTETLKILFPILTISYCIPQPTPIYSVKLNCFPQQLPKFSTLPLQTSSRTSQ